MAATGAESVLRGILAVLEGSEQWSADTLDAIGALLVREGRAEVDSAGMFRRKRRDTLYACAECGSLRIEWQSWVDANSDSIRDSSGDGAWCPRCEDADARAMELQRGPMGWRATWPPFDTPTWAPLRTTIRAARGCGAHFRRGGAA